MEARVKREMALAMAKWWGERVDGSAHHDNGDHDTMASVFAGILADTMNKPAEKAQIDKFVDVLAEKIEQEFEKRNYGRINLDCDYNPCRMLREAAQEAGIDPSNFPWKTNMSACFWEGEDLCVVVSDGYRAPWEQIWPEEKVVQPV